MFDSERLISSTHLTLPTIVVSDYERGNQKLVEEQSRHVEP